MTIHAHPLPKRIAVAVKRRMASDNPASTFSLVECGRENAWVKEIRPVKNHKGVTADQTLYHGKEVPRVNRRARFPRRLS